MNLIKVKICRRHGANGYSSYFSPGFLWSCFGYAESECQFPLRLGRSNSRRKADA